jgi:lauroyl/myristoyl acyltransferase
MQLWNYTSWIQRIDYGFSLPTMANLPLPLGERLAKIRGVSNFFFDYDWRSTALGHRFVRGGTYQAMSMLSPGSGRLGCMVATLHRFIHYSREEWEACLLAGKYMQTIFRQSTFEGFDKLLKYQQDGRGVVLLTCHFDSFVMGIVLLGMAGLRINAVSSSVVEDSRVHPSVQKFYYDKYRNMEKFMNGGKVAHFEKNLRFFYRALERGEAVVILADLPAGSRKTGVIVPFLGSTRRMAPGAWRIAKKTDSALGAFVCLHDAPGNYHVLCYLAGEQWSADPAWVMTPVYKFLDQQIRLRPERWWASELLPKYECV